MKKFFCLFISLLILNSFNPLLAQERIGIKDAYLKGAIEEFIKIEYCKCMVQVTVQDGCVKLYNAPSSTPIREQMVFYISQMEGVKQVLIVTYQDCPNPSYKGRLLPDYPLLWEPWIANPREVMCSLAYRQGDKVLAPSVGAVSFGSEFPIYRFCGVNAFSYKSDIELSLEGCLYAVFNLNPSTPSGYTFTHALIDADYYIGIPVTLAHNKWTFRFRLYHISSHLGDQFMVLNPGFARRNLEFEAIDLKVNYQITRDWMFYAAIGDYIISDSDFPMKSLYFDWGFQYFYPWVYDNCNDILWEPFIAVFFQTQQFENWTLNQNWAIGIRSRHPDGDSTRMAFSLEYYNGRSQDGMFCLFHTSYGQIKFSYAF
jgi:hypothetical protein